MRINEMTAADVWTKAGLMFRDGLAPGSPYVFALVSSGKGAAVQFRSSPGGGAAVAGTVPERDAPGGSGPGFWLRLTREGNAFRGSYSLDLASWTPLGEIAVAMPADVYVGLAVTSHNVGAEGAARFEDLTARRIAGLPEPLPFDTTNSMK